MYFSFSRSRHHCLSVLVLWLVCSIAATSNAADEQPAPEVVETVAATDAVEAVETTDAPEAVEVPDSAEVVEAAEDIEGTEATEAVDVDEAVEVTDAPEVVEVAAVVEYFEGTSYGVTQLNLGYLIEPPNAPDLSELRRTIITLGKMAFEGAPGGIYVPSEQSEDREEFRLDELPENGPVHFSATAIASVNKQIADALVARGLGSIIVAVEEEDIGFTTGEDLRAEGITVLRLTIFMPTIKELQSFATGERIPEDEATNNPAHERILRRSPVQADEAFWPEAVDDYVALLNRHPGRRVVAQLSPSHDQQQLYLDYQITESKPWIAYFEASNTGAKSVGHWQTRVGFIHLQPSNRDDILTADFVINTNANVRSFNTSYETPLWTDRLRLTMDAGYTDYKASDSAGSSFVFDFDGKQARGRLNLSYNVYQYGEYFFDLFSSATFEYIETSEKVDEPGAEKDTGTENFLTTSVGLGVERKNPKLKLRARVSVDVGALNHDTSEGSDFSENLGNEQVDEHPIVLRWDSRLSFFVDALLAEASDPTVTFAHEFVLKYRGQDVFDKYRLIPHYQQVAGGRETVRGYAQGLTAGDSAHVASFEYRFHVPRILKPRPDGIELPLVGDFAIAPRGPGERPDWDWVVKAFYDIGSVRQTDRIAEQEFDDVLQGVGVGTELFFKRNMQLRLDWGMGLDDARCNSAGICKVDKHEWEINFGASIFY